MVYSLFFVSNFSQLHICDHSCYLRLHTVEIGSSARDAPGRPGQMPANAPKPLTDAEAKVTEAYLIIYQFATPKGIEVEVGKEYWPDLANLPDTIKGVIGQHTNKAQMKLKIVWTEKDGKEVHDIEDLHMLLRPHCRFKLVKGPKGEALRLRGQSRVDFQSQQPKRTVTIDYTVGAQTKKQVWTVEDDPEAIKVDERKAPRTKPLLARSREVIKTPFECWYNSAVSHEMLDKAERYINQRLDGKKRETRKTSRGEIVRYLCTMGAIALRPGTSLKKMWQQVRGPKDIFPPPGLGSYGLSKNRFEVLTKLMGECYPLNETGLDPNDPWRHSRMFVDSYNSHMAEVFSPGWNVGPDESMSAWTGAQGDKLNEIPHAMFVERKPEPLGCELEDVADAQCGCIFKLEINEGAVAMAEKEYYDEYGATTACNLRLSKELHNSERAWGGDSWFMSVTDVEVLLDHGLYGYGDVKTKTSRYPTKELQELVGPNAGDWAVMTTTVAGGKKIYAIGHRRGGTVHTYISSHGLSVLGKPQAHKEDVAALGVRAQPRPCPKVLNDWTAQQPQIDKRNRERQRMLAMEKRFLTFSFPFRLFTTVLGMTFTTASCFYDFFYETYDGTFLDFVHELCYDGMTNTIDEEHAHPSATPAAPPTPAADRVPGAPSPVVSPTKAAGGHRLGRVIDIHGWDGTDQPRCSVCGKKTTRVCAQCSTKRVGRIFAVCDGKKRQCMEMHVSDPGCRDHTHRYAHGRKKGTKRKRGADVGGRPRSAGPAATPRAANAGGPRQGAATPSMPTAQPRRATNGEERGSSSAGSDDDEGDQDPMDDPHSGARRPANDSDDSN